MPSPHKACQQLTLDCGSFGRHVVQALHYCPLKQAGRDTLVTKQQSRVTRGMDANSKMHLLAGLAVRIPRGVAATIDALPSENISPQNIT